ncbi:MAG: ketoacyl-ACP synthase III [Bacteroidota bacterium]|nr:ketoacyl-ACP synthase III [Bacteroidota bacterium]
MSTIQALSYILPEKIYSNEDFFIDFPEAKTANMEKTGVMKRHIVAPGQTASDLAVLAGEKLFAEHGIDRNEIDFLLLILLGPDYYMPSTAGIVHSRLGLRSNCGALDMEIGCSGFSYGLSVASGLIAVAGVKKILLLTSSTLTNTLHPKDRGSRFVFGDGAAASLISSEGGGKIDSFVFGNDGDEFEKIIIRDGGSRNPLNPQSYAEITDDYGKVICDANYFMDGIGVFQFSVKRVPALVADVLAKAGLQKEDIDLYVFHQPNVFLNENIRKKIGIPEEKFVHCIAETGNTVQSTIPIALYESIQNGRLKRGMKVLVAGFGVGLSWSGAIIHY